MVSLAGQTLFQSFFMGGFECATHRLKSGKRLDMIAATRHDRFVREDYARLIEYGIRTARDGIRWHLIEERPNRYDFSSALPMIRAARDVGMQVIWDLCHYGWPNDIDIFKPEFVTRFARMAREFTKILVNETDSVPFITPVNEISFFAWASGESAYLNPFATGRSYELKYQLIRAAIEATEAVWTVAPHARIVNVDPAINVVCDPARPQEREAAESYHQLQYHARDILTGRQMPELGGAEKYLDIIGVNYYPFNQWIHGDTIYHPRVPISFYDSSYRPLGSILGEIYERYKRPMFIAETGTEGDERPAWLSYVAGEVAAALRANVPIEGICLYPIINFPGWDDGRHCHNGLWDYSDEEGRREIYQPLAEELSRQHERFSANRFG
jgi:beta-glucosidase/6-phospho-beta-glucosidase/beta-galactosidase